MQYKNTGAFQDILRNSSSPWMDGSGSLGNVVISSRVRLARNLKNVPFPHLLSAKDADLVLRKVFHIADNVGEKGFGGSIIQTDFADTSPLDCQVLVEKHLISPEHAEKKAGKGLILRQDESVAIMINEEDHLRLQVLHSGLELNEAWVLINGIDDLFEQGLEYAYDTRIGYLTSCPTNAGTGLRASVMVHLPALGIANEISRVLTAVNKVGLVVRGFYGEGTKGQGNVFQISNQVTLGQTEKEIIENLSLVVKQVVSEEIRIRQSVLKNHRVDVEDRVFRALGILSNARKITSDESLRLWSDLRLGAEFSMVSDLSISDINEILVLSRPNYLQKIFGSNLTARERDVHRADLIRKHLTSQDV